MKAVLSILSTCWVFFISLMWFYSHSVRTLNGKTVDIQFAHLWGSGIFLKAVIPFVVVFAICILYCLWSWLKQNEPVIKIKKMTVPKIAALGIAAAILAWNASVFLRSPQSIPIDKFFPANFHFIVNFFILFFWVASVLLVTSSTGIRILSLFKIDIKGELPRFLFETGLGFGLWSLIIFAAAWIGVYNVWVILIPAFIFIAAALRDNIIRIKKIFTGSWKIEYNIFDLRIWMFCFGIFLLAINLSDIIRPIPTGWDDLGRYMNKARMIAVRGHIVPGGEMFPFELLASAGFLFSANAALSMAISWLGGLLGSLAIFAIGKRYMSAAIGMTAAAIWYTMPMIAHISYIDMKVDTMLFFISALSLYAFIEWTQNHKKVPWLYLCAVLAGFAWTIKITSALLIAGLSAVFFIQLLSWKDAWRRKIITSFVTIAMLLLPFLPWAIFNISTYGWWFSPYIGPYISSVNPDIIKISQNDWKMIGIDPSICVNSAYAEEVGRYTGNLSGIVKYLRLPWDLTMNTFINDSILIIGFLFLAFLPLWLMPIIKKTQIKPESKILIIFTIVYYALWCWQGNGVPWYGIVMFLPFSLGVANIIYINQPKWMRILLSSIVVISIVSHLVLRSERCGNENITRYSGGQISADEFTKTLLPDYGIIASIIETESARTLRIGTFIPYFINNNDRLLFSDNQLDTFNCIDNEQDDEVTLNRLQKLGFKYIIFDLNTATIESNLGGTLHQKVIRFAEFANRNLKILINNEKLRIAFLKIPGENKL